MPGDRILDLREDKTSIALRARTGGDVVTRGKLVISISDEDNLRVDAAIPAGDASQLYVGMAVRVMLDCYAFQRFDTIAGTITYLAAHTTHGATAQRVAYCLVSVALTISGVACAGA